MVNAAEAIQETGRVSGRIEIDGKLEMENGRECVHLCVKDNGNGIDSEVLKNLFGRGFSHQEGQDRRYRPALVGQQRRHHGRSHVAESKGVGRGAAFHLVLPVSAHRHLKPGSDGGKRGCMTNMPPIAGADGFRILVADDEQAVIDAYRTVIEDINPPFARRSHHRRSRSQAVRREEADHARADVHTGAMPARRGGGGNHPRGARSRRGVPSRVP